MTFSRKFHPLLIVTLSLILIGYFAIKYSVPHILAPKIKEFLSPNIQSQINAENIKFEPIGMVLTFKNLQLADGTSLKNLRINFSIPNPFNKKINISKISAQNLDIEIIKNGNKFEIQNIDHQMTKGSKTKSKNGWQIAIKKIEILESKILFLQNKIEIKKLEISDFDSATKNSLSFKTDLKINDSEINLNGKLSNLKNYPTGDVSFKINDFDLDSLNKILPKIANFGKITGKVSGSGSIIFDKEKFDIAADSEIKNLFFYSEDLQIINYFAREISLKDLKIINNASNFNLKSSDTNIRNLLLSIPVNQFNEKKLSNFSKIRIANIDFDQDKKFLTINSSIDFSDGGLVQVYHQKLKDSKNLHVSIENLDLAQFSESFEYLLKYHIESGKLFLQANTKTANQKIEGDVKVVLSQLQLDNENEFGENLENGSSIPLKTAISMIKDKNSNIDFKFDIYGNENDPNFNPLNILGKGAGSLIISKATTMVATKLASEFAPILLSSIPISPSNILFLANGAYKLVTKPRFNDIKFIQMSDEISEKSQKDLENFSEFLVKHKKLKFRICPTASILESQTIENPAKLTPNQALELANQRIMTLKKYFKAKMANGLEQVIFCRPKISQSSSNISEAEISI